MNSKLLEKVKELFKLKVTKFQGFIPGKEFIIMNKYIETRSLATKCQSQLKFHKKHMERLYHNQNTYLNQVIDNVYGVLRLVITLI